MKIKGDTEIVGVFGDPVKHTLSPLMHNSAFSSLGLNYLYLPFHVNKNDLKDAFSGIAALGIKGVNLTVPHKILALKYVCCADKEAQIIGAVNTIDVKNGKLCGYNTDGEGLLLSIKKDCRFDPKGKNVLILGSGGAARAAAIHLASYGAGKIIIANRTLKKAEKIAFDIRKKVRKKDVLCLPLKKKTLAENADSVHLLINATSVGLHPGETLPVGPEFFKKASSLRLVYDLIYNPPQTGLLRMAASYGIKTSNGMGMLLYQGALSFEIWTGRKAPIGIMRKALTDAISTGKQKRTFKD